MKLKDLLIELRTNLLRDSSTLKTGPPDSYWSDAALVLYINEAHRRFARRALCLRDSTTKEATQITLVPGQAVYKASASVLRVTSARHQDSEVDLVRSTHLEQFTFMNPATDRIDYTGRGQGGKPQRFATDEGLEVGDEHQVQILFDPVPNDDQVGKLVYLRVIRLPLGDMTSVNAEPEIPADWHLDMLEWAAWRALRNWDVDAEANEKAQRHRARFDEAIAECLKEVQQKKMFEPVMWKFGGNGFTYVR